MKQPIIHTYRSTRKAADFPPTDLSVSDIFCDSCCVTFTKLNFQPSTNGTTSSRDCIGGRYHTLSLTNYIWRRQQAILEVGLSFAEIQLHGGNGQPSGLRRVFTLVES